MSRASCFPATGGTRRSPSEHGADTGPLRPGVALAALGTLAFGAVLGPEAPVIALGSAVGVAVTANRRFVIDWRNVQFFSDATRRIDVNVVLHENGQILTQFRNVADDGRERNSATIGIENAAGTVALLYSFNQAVLGPEPAVTSIRYRPPAA